MNRIRFPREHMADYFREQFPEAAGKTVVQPMYPGDALDNGVLIPDSPYRQEIRDGDLVHLIERQYPAEIQAAANPPTITNDDAEALRSEILKNVSERAKLFRSETLNQLRFCVQATDASREPLLSRAVSPRRSGGDPRRCAPRR